MIKKVKMKTLIVNADDFGADAERNRGILEAKKKGIVTSTTVLVRPDLGRDSVRELTETFGSCIGVHLNLTEGTPLVKGLRTLVNPSGLFFGKHRAWRKAMTRGYDFGEVEEELTEQVLHFKALGMIPDHVDGHNHIHVFPGIPEVVARILRRFHLLKVRLPLEPLGRPGQWLEKGVFKKSWIGSLSRRAVKIFEEEEIRFPASFAGIQFPRVSNRSSLLRFLQDLPDGITELMCHPGYRAPRGNPFSNQDRESELFSLASPDVLESISRQAIKLASYGDLE
jgi:chitin disaccharide deacetylase